MGTDDYNNNIFDDDVYSNEDDYDSEVEQEDYVPEKRNPKGRAPLDKVKDFIANVRDKIVAFGVKRAAIIAAVALVLIIVIIICSAVSSKRDKTPKTDKKNNIAVVAEEKSTEPDTPVVKAPTAVQAGAPGTYTVVLDEADSVNMRMAASADSGLITTIPNGTVLEVLFVDDKDKTQNDGYGWGYTEYDGERGWVFMEYLQAGRVTVPNANGSVG